MSRNRTPHFARRGHLTLEWILIASVLVIGLVGGLAALRDAILVEIFGMANAVTVSQQAAAAANEGEPLVCPPGAQNCPTSP